MINSTKQLRRLTDLLWHVNDVAVNKDVLKQMWEIRIKDKKEEIRKENFGSKKRKSFVFRLLVNTI